MILCDGTPSPGLIIEKRLTMMVSGSIVGLKICGILKGIVTNLFHFCSNEPQSPPNTGNFLRVSHFNAGSLGGEVRFVSEGSGHI